MDKPKPRCTGRLCHPIIQLTQTTRPPGLTPKFPRACQARGLRSITCQQTRQTRTQTQTKTKTHRPSMYPQAQTTTHSSCREHPNFLVNADPSCKIPRLGSRLQTSISSTPVAHDHKPISSTDSDPDLDPDIQATHPQAWRSHSLVRAGGIPISYLTYLVVIFEA